MSLAQDHYPDNSNQTPTHLTGSQGALIIACSTVRPQWLGTSEKEGKQEKKKGGLTQGMA